MNQELLNILAQKRSEIEQQYKQRAKQQPTTTTTRTMSSYIPPYLINTSITTKQRIEVSKEALDKLDQSHNDTSSSSNDKNNNSNDKKKKRERKIQKLEREIVFMLQYGSKSFASSIEELIEETKQELEIVSSKKFL